ncbi:serine/threonine-protein kinase, partial [Mycobacterium avium]|uniref:serine/threonine-protein kinase n=14 Tax=Mycobacterium avium TaxID=1764 RepID=UPI000B3070FA
MSSSSRGSRLGTRLGPYELRSLIGTGTLGEVYRAYDTVKDRLVALKLLRGELDAGFRQRLWRECRAVTRLQEPHVLPLHDFGEIDGVPFIDMQLVDDGGSLKELLREQGGLEPSRAASITGQVARALDAAHAAGLMHLDVKPENILLTHDHFTYLADFGLAQAAGDEKLSRTYMAPERFTTGSLGPQTDIYSLACVLYECLTGQPPFEGADPGELRSAHLLSPAPRPSIMRRGVGRAFDDIITRGMAKQRSARFASAGELARAASEAVFAAYEPVSAAAGLGGPRPLPAPPAQFDDPDDTLGPPPVGERPPRGPAGRLPVVVTAVAVLMLIAGVVLSVKTVVGTHHNNSAPPPAPTTRALPVARGTGPGGERAGVGGLRAAVGGGRARRAPSLAGAAGAVRRPGRHLGAAPCWRATAARAGGPAARGGDRGGGADVDRRGGAVGENRCRDSSQQFGPAAGPNHPRVARRPGNWPGRRASRCRRLTSRCRRRPGSAGPVPCRRRRRSST